MNEQISDCEPNSYRVFIEKNRGKLGDFARNEYSEKGRGTLVVVLEANGQCPVVYAGPGELKGFDPALLNAYDPAEEYLLVIAEGNLPPRLYRLLLENESELEVPHKAEPIFNLFVYDYNGIIEEVGAVRHVFAGEDHEKIAFLQSRVNADFYNAKRYQVPQTYMFLNAQGKRSYGITYGTFLKMAKENKQLRLFEAAFKELNAPKAPLFCITPIVNNVPKIEAVMRF